jgi:hypothetical protein
MSGYLDISILEAATEMGTPTPRERELMAALEDAEARAEYWRDRANWQVQVKVTPSRDLRRRVPVRLR